MRTVVVTGGVLAAMLMSVPAAADVKAGVDAWRQGDYKAAVEQWRPLAIAGDPDAEYNLGQAYKLGRGVPVDPVLAESWFGKAAAQGHEQAQENYGIALFQDGKKAEAVPWLEKAVARDAPRAQLVYGTMLFNGDGVARDYPRSYALMTRAAAPRGSTPGLPSAAETLTQMDGYISAPDRQRGTALAQQYAAHVQSTEIAALDSGTRAGDTPPVQPEPAARPDPRNRPASHGTVPPPAIAAQAHAPAPHDGAPVADTATAERGPRPGRPAPAPARVGHPEPTAAAPARDRGPARASVPAPPPRPARGWRVQLGAFSEAGNAQALWSKLSGRFGGVDAAYVKAGRVTRLQAGPYRTRAEAQRACSAAHVSCVVVAP